MATSVTLLLLAVPADAQQPPEASIWYRASAQCPDADAFLNRLGPRGVKGKIASVGDRVDFVVTLGNGGAGASGRLERQTNAGTVAVRELTASSCDEVADGIALSLVLAVDPRQRAGAEPTAVPAEAPAAPAKPDTPPRNSTPVPRDRSEPAPPDGWARSGWSLGAEGMITTGIAPAALLGVGVFLDRAIARRSVLSPSFRLTVVGAQASSTTPRGDLQFRLGALRLEGCPVALAGADFELRPCAGAEVGIAAADGSGPTGASESRAWGDVVTHARLAWSPMRAWSFEGQIGAVIPLTRYSFELVRPAEVVHRTAPVGLGAAVGAAYHWQ
ncbi:MAG: hypothetical protein WKG00_13475 [Polyangiaceae bacterium]